MTTKELLNNLENLKDLLKNNKFSKLDEKLEDLISKAKIDYFTEDNKIVGGKTRLKTITSYFAKIKCNPVLNYCKYINGIQYITDGYILIGLKNNQIQTIPNADDNNINYPNITSIIDIFNKTSYKDIEFNVNDLLNKCKENENVTLLNDETTFAEIQSKLLKLSITALNLNPKENIILKLIHKTITGSIMYVALENNDNKVIIVGNRKHNQA